MRELVRTYAIEIVDSAGELLGAELVPCTDEHTALTLARTAVALFRGGRAARVCCVATARRWELDGSAVC